MSSHFFQPPKFCGEGEGQAIWGGPPHILTCTGSFRPGGGAKQRGGFDMGDTYPHGDVDDMIYQEEWQASAR